MNSFRALCRQARRGAAAFGVLGAVATLSLAPALVASAATITSRSIALSSSAAGATNVSYDVTFTPASSGTNAFVVEFCSDSPAVGTTCEAPSGFTAAGATTPTGNTIGTLTKTAANAVMVTLGTAATAGTSLTVPINNITNPSGAGSLYARMVTYASATDAEGFTPGTSSTVDGLGTYQDTGSVALSINNEVSVNGEVLESLVFCASGAALSGGCGGTVTAPNLSLGTSGVLGTGAITGAAAGTGTVYTMVSTNANSGAVVSMKSDATGCGGLINSSAPTKCYIAPAGTTPLATIAAGASQFGMELAGLSNGTGTGTLAASAPYATSGYTMDYVNGDATGVTSPYGSPIYNTSGGPISSATANLVFGANTGNETPAGNYSADLDLIATGTY